MSFAGQKALDRLRQIVGPRLNASSFEDLQLPSLRYPETKKGGPTAYDVKFPYNEKHKIRRKSIAYSFDRAHRHLSVGGVVIGRPPDKQDPGLVLTDIKWRQMSKGVRFTLYTDSTTPTTLAPVASAIVATALAYAADGRVIAVTILNDENGQDQTIYLHPALKDTRIGQHMIAIDKWIFESMQSTMKVKDKYCEESQKISDDYPDKHRVSGVRENSFELDSKFAFLKKDAESMVGFMVLANEDQKNNPDGPKKDTGYSEDMQEEIADMIKKRLKDDADDRTRLSDIADFIRMQRLFRLIFEGRIGNANVVFRLAALAEWIAKADKYHVYPTLSKTHGLSLCR